MPVTSSVDDNLNQVIVEIEGDFCFDLVRDFRRAYQERRGFKFIIDLRKVHYIDSAGLGMLLNMQQFLSASYDSIRIINTLPQVKKILLISRFDKKFIIE